MPLNRLNPFRFSILRYQSVFFEMSLKSQIKKRHLLMAEFLGLKLKLMYAELVKKIDTSDRSI